MQNLREPWIYFLSTQYRSSYKQDLYYDAKDKTTKTVTLKLNMKSVLIFAISIFPLLLFSQTHEYELFLMQHGEDIKIKNNQARIEKHLFNSFTNLERL